MSYIIAIAAYLFLLMIYGLAIIEIHSGATYVGI